MGTGFVPRMTPSTEASKPSAFASRRQFIHLGLATLGAAWLGIWLQSLLFPSQNTTQEAKPVTFPLSDMPVGGTNTVSR